MDYFNNVFTAFLDLERVSCVAVYAGSESSRISSKISYFVFRGLEWREGEKLIPELSFLGELSL